MKNILIIDSYSLIFRAFYAMLKSNLRSLDGNIPTGAIVGFFNMVFNAIKKFKPDECIFAFDTGKKTFRHFKFKEYKAKRKEIPKDLIPQFDYIKKVIKNSGWFLIYKDGYEADDIIGSLVSKNFKDHNVIVLSGDRDLLQLLDISNLKIFLMKKGISEMKEYNLETLINEYGVNAEEFLDLKALMGDSSDNIPGVPGIGEKTALKLIKEYKTLDNIFKDIENIGGKLKDKLLKGKELAYLSKELSKIVRDLTINLDEFKNVKNKDELLKIFNELGLKELKKEYKLENIDKKDECIELKQNYKTVFDIIEWKKLIEFIKKKQRFSIDLETTSEDIKKAKIVGIAISIDVGEAFYIPISHNYLGVPKQLNFDLIINDLKGILENREILKIGHNFKYEYSIFKILGIKTQSFFDTMIASYLINPDEHRHGLDHLSKIYFSYKMLSFKELFGSKKNSFNFSEIDISKATFYACEDADFTLRLYEVLLKKLKELNLYTVFKDIEIPLVPVLSFMELNGIKIDTKYFNELDRYFSSEIEILKNKIFEISGEEFNINSTKQLSKILFEKLMLPTFGMTTKGTNYSTNIKVLERLSKTYPIADLIIRYRTLVKLKNTYVESLPKLVFKDTGRIYTSFNQTVTATGRLSSSNPNLQNIPVRGEEGAKIRYAFIADNDKSLLSFDYSQIELRVLAHISEENKLIEAFKNNKDIHSETASYIFDVPENEITSDMRRKAKEINFGVIYGLNAYGLSSRLKISVKDAKEYLNRFFKQYPMIKLFINNTIKKAEGIGYVETLFGRKRWLNAFFNRSGKLIKHGANIAINAPIQGTAADIIKLAMIEIYNNTNWNLLLQIHDELIFEVKDECIDNAVKEIKNIMENVCNLKVPLKVSVGYGKSWGDIKK